jgi:LPXTG-motif cell wall-anchored protein
MNDTITWVFETIQIDGVSAAEIFPEQRATAIADSLEMVREGYEMFGIYQDPTQAELDSRAVVDAFVAERMNNSIENIDFSTLEEVNFIGTQAQDSTNMLPFAVGGAALIAGGLYLFSRKNEQKSNTSPFLSQ